MTRFLVGTSEIKFLPPRGEVPRETGAIDAAIGIRMLGFYCPDGTTLFQVAVTDFDARVFGELVEAVRSAQTEVVAGPA